MMTLDSQKIASSFASSVTKLTYKTSDTLENRLQNTTTLDNKYSLCGDWKLTCNECPKFYIGVTGRDFHTRYIEHIKHLSLIHI